MRKQFHNFPANTIEAYQQIMQRITQRDSKKIILRILSWIRYSERLLSGNELREIIWVEDKDKQLNTKDIDGFCVDDIIRNCESLVTFDQATHVVRFSHNTVQEFLDKSSCAGDLMSHSALAKTCLTYLNFEIFGVPCIHKESLWVRMEKHVFSRYAAAYWAVHARNANTEDAIWDDMVIAIIDIFKQDGKRESAQQLQARPSGKYILRDYHTRPTRKSLLHILIESQFASFYMPPLSHKISNVNYTYVITI
jgi:hypothetical protein